MLKRLSVLVLVLALVAAACGDDDAETTTTTGASTRTAVSTAMAAAMASTPPVAWIAMALRWLAITSCSSRAIRARSAATGSWSCTTSRSCRTGSAST